MDTGTVAASAICIFEMTGRVGGRTMSLRGLGPEEDLVVDVGAYRTWPEYTPIAHALITDYLGLPVHCYDPGDVPCAKFNIATEVGSDRKAGFGTFVEEMMNRLVNAGARWFPNYELKAIAQSSAPADKQLTFGNGAQAVASKLILNMPQRPLLKLHAPRLCLWALSMADLSRRSTPLRPRRSTPLRPRSLPMCTCAPKSGWLPTIQGGGLRHPQRGGFAVRRSTS